MAYSTSVCVGLFVMALAAAWLGLGLRIFVRHVMQGALYWDDLLAVLALMFFTCQTGFCLDGVIRGGLGSLDFASADSSIISMALKDFFFSEIMFILGTGLIKISFNLTLLRIVLRRLHIYTLYALFAITATITLISFFLVLFTCYPIRLFWNNPLEPTRSSHCHNVQSQIRDSYAHGAVMLFVDITLGILLPMHIISGLQMEPRVKIGARLLLSLGSFAGIATLIRLISTGRFTSSDFLYASNVPLVWSALELGSSIFFTSLVMLKPLFVAMKIFCGSMSNTLGSHGLEEGNTDSYPKGSKTQQSKIVTTSTGDGIRGRHSTKEGKGAADEGIELRIQKVESVEVLSVPRPAILGNQNEAWCYSLLPTRE